VRVTRARASARARESAHDPDQANAASGARDVGRLGKGGPPSFRAQVRFAIHLLLPFT
jgi:hypothetical protein